MNQEAAEFSADAKGVFCPINASPPPSEGDSVSIPALYKSEAYLELLKVKEGEICLDLDAGFPAMMIGAIKRGASVCAVSESYARLRDLSANTVAETDHALQLYWDPKRSYRAPESFDVAWIRNLSGQPEDAAARLYDQLMPGGRALAMAPNVWNYGRLFCESNSEQDCGPALSISRLEAILKNAGFRDIVLYSAFPDPCEPDLLLPWENGLRFYREHGAASASFSARLKKLMEITLMKKFKCRALVPAFVATAVK
ncbi:MAG: hypothetical protein G3M78_03275 [Candidatus Nitrohelix vancouverensis]|uniref:Methyltransferase n=1 Tax=Candidatus Nitrohelix vancouverensis TaxID=2705534 RepID=A0A7T0C0U3_9BACT|nr:MAG: hypothetical protein G3M78_03275 [Candidatus Nitrohelix vancouverensis]